MTSANDFTQCPTCKHMHPGSVGLSICLCTDCYLWFGGVPRSSLSDESAARLAELVKKVEAR